LEVNCRGGHVPTVVLMKRVIWTDTVVSNLAFRLRMLT
jgi:hypothetical protein